MHFDKPLLPATLVRRYKRFLADVVLEDGREMTLHCPNTGSMRNCSEPGWRIWYSESDNPKRKYPGTWELVEIAGSYLACVNTGRANALVEEAVREGVIPALQGYAQIRREVAYGAERSRIDLLLEGDQGRCYIEVKNVTLQRAGTAGAFPDAVSARGTKHLRELMAVVAAGDRAVLLFCVAHTGIETVQAAGDIDPLYAQTLRAAVAAGVEVYAWQVAMDTRGMRIEREVPVFVNSALR